MFETFEDLVNPEYLFMDLPGDYSLFHKVCFGLDHLQGVADATDEDRERISGRLYRDFDGEMHGMSSI
ncbi:MULTISPECIES: hypothetical protein [unclassified Methanoculleus]|uniref:hypothetical protein n=2 Tax=unclassified Methanoculleus TaxID=2619537 RepID=UPI00319DC8A0|nr:hypothetical protein [Methanoculleus sp.]